MKKLFKIMILNKLFIAVFWSILTPTAHSSSDSIPEAKLKAGLIYNFIKHTQWPNEAALTAIHITFLGDEPSVYNEFNNIAEQEKIRGKQLIASKAITVSRNNLPQVLVIDPKLNSNINALLQTTNGTGTLIITDNLSNKELVMINFYRPSKNEISFEINKRNIAFEGLRTSNDILLNGGTPIEIAALYREMENSLSTLKSQIAATQTALFQKNDEIQAKNREIQQLQQTLTANNEQIQQQQQDIKAQTEELERLNQEFKSTSTDLEYNKKILLEREQNLQQLSQEIKKNKSTLRSQKKRIESQALEVEKSQTVLAAQDQTITSQKNIITLALLLLLIFLAILIISLRKSLSHERALTETNNALIISQKANIDTLKSADKLKSDFLSSISHEMRTPMHGILGTIETIDASSITKHLSHAIDTIKTSAEDMHDIVENILVYTDIQSGQLKPQYNAVHIHEFIDDLTRIYTHRCQVKSLQFQCIVDPDLPTVIELDKSKVTSILQQLLNNAVKFTSSGSITLNIHYQQNGNQARVSFAISDTGIGISSEQQSAIFNPFHQHEAGLTRRFGGLGIGLNIAKALTTLLNGQLDVTPNIEAGSTFTLQLPTTKLVAQPHQRPLQNRLQPILIVEDNLINQQVLDLMLHKLGYTTLIAHNGQEAIDLLQTEHPSLILMDLQMPVMDGITCTQLIRRRIDEAKYTPIVAITANLLESQKQECIEAGMNDYLGKPIELIKLKETLDKYSPITA